MSIGIYKIENLLNHKIYIGQSRNISQRWKDHRNLYKKDDSPLYRAMRKYGIENFSFKIIEECPIDLLNERECYWIKYYNSLNEGYNQTLGGEHGFPSKLTEEDFQKIYDRLKGQDTMEKIAEDFNVTHPTISNINNGLIWVHSDIEYPIRKRIEKKKYYCIDCGKEISTNAIRCIKCNALFRKKEKPISREELKQLIRTQSFVSIGKSFNVSDNTIRKWCKGFNLPYKKAEIKQYTDEEWEKI